LITIEFLALSRKFFTNYATHWWDNSVGQFGTRLMADFQFVATEIWDLYQKFFTNLLRSVLGQVSGTKHNSKFFTLTKFL
jgi:hypothetical protein